MSTQVVLITGALTGIGRAAAVAFAKKGAKVVVSGRRDEIGHELVKEFRGYGAGPSSSMTTCARKAISAHWSTRLSHGSDVSTWL